ncbi:MAG TPA: DegT/DnrJ/EryC1/StrS family aminotransferase [Nocardioidaceae bacterium]|nr:DegT/DnrJ/EryC1/StrS family aminotransferase [Nocardioidaceae bacterium]
MADRPDDLDPRALRGDAPLFDAYLRAVTGHRRSFTIPGHKGRPDLVGPLATWDVPLYGGLDEVKQTHGRLAEAERRAAGLWGADFCRFSVGGATHGNQALALAVTRPGEPVVVPRTLHRSLLVGLVLSGAVPVWVRPDVDPELGLPLGVRADQVADALARQPRATAVFTGDPSYVGTIGETAAVAEVAHRHGIPLVVDAAWGAHFGFHPRLPAHALGLGADALVTSVHKALPGQSQAALVLARTRRIDPGRLDAAVEATATTSPAGSTLASIDASRALLARDGETLLDALLDRVARARATLIAIDGVRVLAGDDVDPAKLVVLLPGTGADGNRVERDLLAAGLPVEMADRDTLVPMLTLADGDAEVDALVETIGAAVARHHGPTRKPAGAAAWTVSPVTECSPRDAYFADHLTVPAAEAVGCTSAELVAPYPPGIPVLAPGERITEEALTALLAARDSGTRIAYAADPSLSTLRVVDR